MFRKAFLLAALERAIKAAAQTVILVLGADLIDVFAVNWLEVASFAAGGFILSVLTSIVSAAATDGNPSVGSAEVLSPPAPKPVDPV